MPTIDADAHVVETEATWDYMDASDQHMRPELVGKPESGSQFWMVDGKICGLARAVLTDQKLAELSKTGARNVITPEAARDMEDVGMRLRHMDDLGIDTQVLYSTIYIEQVADTPEYDVAIARGYNRWLADIWRQGGGRLRWACVPPVLDMDEAIKQVREAVKNGACGATMRPIEGNRLPTDPYFYPLYEEANNLNIPIVFHIANANPADSELVGQYNARGVAFWKFRIPTVGACMSILMSDIPEMFPKLRFGYIECSSQFVPWLVTEARRRSQSKGRDLGPNMMKDKRIYVTCQTNDDLPWVLKYAGEDNLIIGTDYGHTDPASQMDVMRIFRDDGEIEPRIIDKIIYDNSKALYGI